jgi:hypothetical protein
VKVDKYLAYLEMLLSSGEAYKKTVAQSALSIQDDAGPVDKAGMTNAMAEDFKARKTLTFGRKTLDLVG